MASEKTILYFGSTDGVSTAFVAAFAEDRGLRLEILSTSADVHLLLNRTFPAGVVVDGDNETQDLVRLIRELKGDPFTGIVPTVVLHSTDGSARATNFLEAGADDVIHAGWDEKERILRLEQVLRRADRDVSVNPTTRLPGPNHIARDMQRRLDAEQKFAVCYADLDHFKEFNDRYGYARGDGIIRMLSRIIRDMVRGLAPGGFVGHIGGDDFIFIVPVEYLEATCDLIIQVFDELIPFQYTEEDRRAGYFLGKDRRNNIHRIPLMTLSVGVVTNQMQAFDHTGQISELAAEMKSYAKSLPGSKYVVDRRHQALRLPTAAADQEAALADIDPLIHATTST